MDQEDTATRDLTSILPRHCQHPTDRKGNEGHNDLFHSDMIVLPHWVISISYKKLVHDLDLQVSITSGLANIQIYINEMDSA